MDLNLSGWLPPESIKTTLNYFKLMPCILTQGVLFAAWIGEGGD